MSAQSNPESLRFLMEQMKQNASGLTKIQFQLQEKHRVNLDEKSLDLTARDEQLKGE